MSNNHAYVLQLLLNHYASVHLLSLSFSCHPLLNLDALPHFFLFISTLVHNLFLGPALPIYPNLFLDTCLLTHTCCSCPSSRVISPKLHCPKSLLLTIYSTATLRLIVQKMIRAISSHETDPRKDECKCQTSLLSHNYICPIPNGANRT